MFFAFSDQAECKSTIHWLCDYVSYQANKKATHHSRDLHSMIVAAFSCLQTWITSHPWLLDSQVCIILLLARLVFQTENTREIPIWFSKVVLNKWFHVKALLKGFGTRRSDRRLHVESPCKTWWTAPLKSSVHLLSLQWSHYENSIPRSKS